MNASHIFASFTTIVLLCGDGSCLSSEFTADTLLKDYLFRTINRQRFEAPHSMQIFSEFTYPEPRPSVFVEWIRFRYSVTGHMYKAVAEIGPAVKDSGAAVKPFQEAAEVHTHIWNGKSEANFYVHRPSGTTRLTISRGEPSTDVARSNKYLEALGLPRAESDGKIQGQRILSLSHALGKASKLKLLEREEIVDGIVCRVVNHGDADRLWFECRGKSVRLIKRDVWRSIGIQRREVYHFRKFREDGLPSEIDVRVFYPVEAIGRDSRVNVEERMILEDLTFTAPGDSEYFVTVPEGTDVLDIKSMTAYQVQSPNSYPFEKLLHDTPPAHGYAQRNQWVHPFLLAHVALLGVVLLLVGIHGLPRHS